MDKRPGNSIKLMVCLLIVVGGFASSSQESQTPRFGSGIVILEVSERSSTQFLYEPNLSPTGEFVFANSASFDIRDPGRSTLWRPNVFLGGIQILWDIWGLDRDGYPTYLDPMREEELIEWPYIESFVGTERGPIRAFSPDGRYVAMKSYTDVSIFTIPELEMYRNLPFATDVRMDRYWDDSLKWSPDGQLLATLVDNEIIVWDVENDVVERHKLRYNYETLTSFEDGWFGLYIGNPSREEANSFFACDVWLHECQEHNIRPNSKAFITLDGEIVLEDLLWDSIDFWYRQNDGQYQKGERSVSEINIRPLVFSPDGQYIAYWEDGAVREFPSLDVFFTIREWQRIAWLPDGQHLVTFFPFDLTMELYELGNEEPIDRLDFTEIFSEEQIAEWYEHNIITSQTLDVSNDGRWVLVNFGFAALVVPIVYE
jgi:WD40 repeat protein